MRCPRWEDDVGGHAAGSKRPPLAGVGESAVYPPAGY